MTSLNTDELPFKHIDLNCTDPALLWAEIFHLREAISGPPGFVSWKDAATYERSLRKKIESNIPEFMQVSMAPTYEFANGWNACVSTMKAIK